MPTEKAPAPIARESELLCAGFIEYMPPQNQLEVVGGEQEQEQNLYAVGDYVYINTGTQQGVSEGQEFSVVRPRGEFSSKFSGKRGSLGIYTQEVGRLRVTEVKAQVSIAIVSASCQALLLGDLLRPALPRPSSVSRAEEEIDRFAEPSGKQTGRIVLARDAREVVSKNQIVFIDLGTEDNIKAGDYLTVYRSVGTPNVARIPNEEIARNASSGFESEHFRGGKFSNQAQRVKDPTDARRINPPITSPEVKDGRPLLPRKIVGEVVVLNVQQRTATVMITRTAQEIHTGDFVELQ
ncbi:MAG TPA: hypothetical protein VM866_06425 [Pyrinomonadaceae bacterium]|nr:hypothetical protein [Pyrinomonadaceae bacterium]